MYIHLPSISTSLKDTLAFSLPKLMFFCPELNKSLKMYGYFIDARHSRINDSLGFVVFHFDLFALNSIRECNTMRGNGQAIFDRPYQNLIISANDANVVIVNTII